MWVPGQYRSPSAAEAEPVGRRGAAALLRPAATGLFAVLLPLVSACSAPVPGPEPGDWLVIPVSSEPESLNFVLAGNTPAKWIGRLVADSLVDHDENLRLVPRLAASWEFSDDQRTLTFRLRDGVRWHDGAPFRAEDVVFTYERIVDPASGPNSKRSQFREVERVEAPDHRTVRVTYGQPYAAALYAWQIPILPKHIFESEDFLTSSYNRRPVGTGPYRFVEWKTARQVVLEANRDYWGIRPSLDRIVFRIIPSRNTQYQALLAGEVDLAVLPPERWQELRDRSEPGPWKFYRYSTLRIAYIAWNGNGDHAALADPRVRRAFTLLTDRREFVERVMLGFGEIAASPFHPALSAHDPDLAPLPHDPQEAGRLLDAAGWKIPAGGGFREKDGDRLGFRLLTSSGTDWQEKFSVLLQESFGRAGVEVRIRRVEYTALIAQVRKGAYEAAVSTWGLDIDPDPFPFAHSSQIGGGWNLAAYRNAEVDRLLEEGRRILDSDRRDQIFREIGDILARDQPYTFLFFFSVPLAIDSRFENVKFSPLGFFDWYPGILDWYVPEGRRKYGRSGSGQARSPDADRDQMN